MLVTISPSAIIVEKKWVSPSLFGIPSSANTHNRDCDFTRSWEGNFEIDLTRRQLAFPFVRPSRWPVSADSYSDDPFADSLQNQRTRLNTISRRRLIETGTIFPPPQHQISHSRFRYERRDHTDGFCSIKKPKTFRYPSLKGTDPKFRRNHKHALHGTMKALKEVKEGKRDAA
jgi:large subunit ribosomal protein L29e